MKEERSGKRGQLEMFSFIAFTVGWNEDKKEFDISFLSFRTNAGFRSLFRFIHSKTYTVVHLFWTFSWSRRTVGINREGKIIERRKGKDV